jgi:hypothetical protein
MTIGDLLNAVTLAGGKNDVTITVVTKNGKELALRGFRMVTNIPEDGSPPMPVFQILGL